MRAGPRQFEMLAALGDIDVTAEHALPVRGFAHRHAADFVQPFGEGCGKAWRHVLGDENGGRIGR